MDAVGRDAVDTGAVGRDAVGKDAVGRDAVGSHTVGWGAVSRNINCSWPHRARVILHLERKFDSSSRADVYLLSRADVWSVISSGRLIRHLERTFDPSSPAKIRSEMPSYFTRNSWPLPSLGQLLTTSILRATPDHFHPRAKQSKRPLIFYSFPIDGRRC